VPGISLAFPGSWFLCRGI